MDKLFDLYKSANEKNSWVRVPVINYLRACPLPKAKELLTECEKIDPAAVKRANTFFPTAPQAPATPANKATQANPAGGSESQVAAKEPALLPATTGTSIAAIGSVAASSSAAEQGIVTAVNEGVELAPAARKTPAAPANLWLVLGVPWTVGLTLLAVQWSILRGGAK
jgi:hypothetical protein